MDLNLQDTASLLLTPLIGCYKGLKLVTQFTASDFIGLRFFDKKRAGRANESIEATLARRELWKREKRRQKDAKLRGLYV